MMRYKIHMKNKINFKRIIKIILTIIVGVYIISIFINQQKTLNSYKKSYAYYQTQLDNQNKYKEELTEIKNNINSPEYIEKIAREKLDMYLPNERVYIDIGQ